MSDQSDPRVIAAQAEKDLNSYAAKVGHPAGQSDSGTPLLPSSPSNSLLLTRLL